MLGVESVGVDQSFFDVGGYSQLAVRLVMELSEALGVDVPIGVLFQAQSIEGLARAIGALGGDRTAERPKAELRDDELYGHYARRAMGVRLKAIGADKHYVRGHGNTLTYVEDGKEVEVLDMVGGYGSTLLGHNHPELVALARSMLDAEVPMHAQFSNAHAAGALCRALADRLESATGSAFVVTLASSGTEAVEAAIKHAKMEYRARAHAIARQVANMAALLIDQIDKGQASADRSFFQAVETETGTRATDLRSAHRALALHNERIFDSEPLFLGLSHAFHGLTSGALSLTASEDFRQPFHWMGVRAELIEERRAALEAALAAERAYLLSARVGPNKTVTLVREPWVKVCAFLVEPIQGEGGIRPVDREFLADLRRLADAHGFPVVVDEIQSGMGRTGFFTAAEGLGLKGDYYTFSKSLGGGLSKVSAMAVRAPRYQEDFGAVHGSTYAEDAPGCRIALATLSLIERDGLIEVCARKGELFIEKLRGLKREHPEVVHAVRGMG